jgi:hypothetical protein
MSLCRVAFLQLTKTLKFMEKILFREAYVPESNEKIKNGAVTWGKDNLYPQFLVSLYEDNPVHGGIINQKVNFITSGGVSGNTEVINNGNQVYSIEEIIDSITLDVELFNGFSIIFKRNLLTKEWEAKPIDFELVRATEDLIYYEVSDNWRTSQRTEKNNYKKIKNIHHVTDQDNECIFVNIHRPKQRILEETRDLTSGYYPRPNYSGAITSIMAGCEMDFFTYSEVVNGWKGGTLINMANGVPSSEEEIKKVTSKIKRDATRKETQGGLIVTFSNGKDNAPEAIQINGNDLDKRYIESNKEIMRKIMIAHSVISPALFGVMSESLFGSKEEMATAYALFKTNYVRGRQRFIEDGINWAYFKLNKVDPQIKFNDYTPDFLIEKVEAQPNPTAQFSKEDEAKATNEVIGLFAQCGRSTETVKVIHSACYQDTSVDNESDFKASYTKSKFNDLTDEQKRILTMVGNGETYQAINSALGKGGKHLSQQLIILGDLGYLEGWKLTDLGNENVISPDDFEVVYSYAKRPGVSGDDILPNGRTRPFCEALINLNKVYTRAEIDNITNVIGRDVWTYRGGWYHNPNTDKNTPFCRHIWKQNLIIKS